MTNPATRLLPISPLLELLNGEPAGMAATRCGVGPRSVHRWRAGETTTITIGAADRIAVALGMHPGEIWDGWWSIPTHSEMRRLRALDKVTR